MNDSLFNQPNPLIDECSAETLVNIQAMLARIQILQIDRRKDTRLMDEHFRNSINPQSPCPGNELYKRLLILVREALDYEIDKVQNKHGNMLPFRKT